MADINLLQTQVKDTTHTSTIRTKIVVWIGAIVLLVMVGIGGVLYFMTKQTNDQAQATAVENASLQKQIDQQDASLRGAKAYQAKLSNIALLLKNHIYLSNLFAELEQYTYLKAKYGSFDLNQDTGKIHLQGNVDSYTGLGKLLLALSSSPHFRNVKLVAVLPSTSTASGYLFSMEMTVTPEIFNLK